MDLLLDAVLREHDGILPVVEGSLATSLVHRVKPADLLGKPGGKLAILGLQRLEPIPALGT